VYALAVVCASAGRADAETTRYVAAGGNLQEALNAAQPGDTVLLAEGAEFVGNFVLPAKTGEGWITVRSSAPDALLPAPGARIRPADAPLLARLRSPNTNAALRTAAGAHHWMLRYLEFGPNQNGYGDIIRIGDGSSAQNSLDQVPHHFVLSHLYVHGDVRFGQKRGIALNAAHVTIVDSHVAECKGVGQDTQAIGGWNGPGPYVIENNYLEGAGENVMFGGADPAIPGLVADGIVFRRNYLSRPMAWRDPILQTPAQPRADARNDGSLPAGTYAYRIVARGSVGQGITGRSSASAEVSAEVTAGGAVRIRWEPVAGASEYRIYGRTAGAQTMYWRVTTTEFVDTGVVGTSEDVPTTPGTVWTVKNLFELKNARNEVVEANVMENHWKQAQAGYAIVFTPRNSNGACTWCVVENVRFEYNVIRNVAAGINLLGYDIPSRPTAQTRNVAFRHNLFSGMATSLGGNAWFMLIGDEPRDIALEHNTVDSNGGTLVYVYGGTSSNPREVLGFRLVANAARHGLYGVGGAYFAYGTAMLNAYFPDAVVEANYLAGASAARYPSGTLTAGYFQDQFVAFGSDFTVREGSVLKGAAPDGSDVGADYARLAAKVAGVESGITPPAPQAIVPPSADFTVTCAWLSCTFTDASTAGTAAITARTWTAADGYSGEGPEVSHAFAAPGTYSVTLSVVDANGLTAEATQTVTVEAPVPPAAALSVACTYLACSYADRSTPGSTPLKAVSWSFGDGAGAAEAGGTHSYTAAGTYTIVLTVTDLLGLTSSASTTVMVEPPNVVPVAAFTHACTDLTCTFTDNSTDADGTIAVRRWSIGGTPADGAAVAHQFAATGTYDVVLTVVDDDGAEATVSAPVTVRALVHAGAVEVATTKWYAKTNPAVHYWSANVTLGIHGGDERIVAGATITAAWSGALTKTVTCTTSSAGVCTFKSGTLSMWRGTVTLTVLSVALPDGDYHPAGNHNLAGNAEGTAITSSKP
jgi:PKD repeat protein